MRAQRKAARGEGHKAEARMTISLISNKVLEKEGVGGLEPSKSERGTLEAGKAYHCH
jgi:hypothetical protein